MRMGASFDTGLVLVVGALFLSMILIVAFVATKGPVTSVTDAATTWMEGLEKQGECLLNSIVGPQDAEGSEGGESGSGTDPGC